MPLHVFVFDNGLFSVSLCTCCNLYLIHLLIPPILDTGFVCPRSVRVVLCFQFDLAGSARIDVLISAIKPRQASQIVKELSELFPLDQAKVSGNPFIPSPMHLFVCYTLHAPNMRQRSGAGSPTLPRKQLSFPLVIVCDSTSPLPAPLSGKYSVLGCT